MVKIKVPAGAIITTQLLPEGGSMTEIKDGEIIDPDPDPDPDPGPDDPIVLLSPEIGAIGDGRANDTAAIQKAVDLSSSSGRWIVPGERADDAKPVFIINSTGTLPFGNIRCRVGVRLKDNVKLDGKGACEFKMGSNQFCYMFTNADQDRGNKGWHLRGFELNGHRRAQPERPSKGSVPSDAQENGGIGVYRIEDCVFEDIFAWNCQVHSMRNWHAKRCTYKRLRSEGNDGDSWSFGQDGKECVDCHIEDVYAEDCQNGTYSNKQGNNIITSAIGCTFAGTHTGIRCGGGFKIQGRSKNTTVTKSHWVGGPKGKLGTRNSGLKIQGNQNSSNERDWVQDVTVDECYSENCQSEGLRFSHCKRNTVKKATLVDCALDDAGALVFREVSHDNRVDDLTIKNSRRHGIEARMPDVHRCSVGKMDLDGCGGNGIQHSGNGTFTVDEATMRNVQGRHVNSSRGKVVIKLLRADKNLSISGNVEVQTFERL